MKEKKSKRVIVRVTEQQLKNLMDLVVAEQITISEVLRGSMSEKLNKIKEYDQREK